MGNRIMFAARALVFASLAVFTAACASGGQYTADKAKGSIEEVIARHSRDLMAIPGVVGTAEGKCGGKPCIKVYVKKKTPALAAKIPERIEGYPVEIEETGRLKAL